jgi:PII-like signaling protein
MVIVGEDTMFAHKPLYTEIVRRAHACGLAGASVFRGVEGFGQSRRVHTSRILDLADRLPAMIIIIDTEDNIARFLPQLHELDVRGVVAIDDVEVVAPGYLARPGQP